MVPHVFLTRTSGRKRKSRRTHGDLGAGSPDAVALMTAGAPGQIGHPLPLVGIHPPSGPAGIGGGGAGGSGGAGDSGIIEVGVGSPIEDYRHDRLSTARAAGGGRRSPHFEETNRFWGRSLVGDGEAEGRGTGAEDEDEEDENDYDDEDEEILGPLGHEDRTTGQILWIRGLSRLQTQASFPPLIACHANSHSHSHTNTHTHAHTRTCTYSLIHTLTNIRSSVPERWTVLPIVFGLYRLPFSGWIHYPLI
ncbi:unnamed protein product [Protopolystoma xenopodis]|uniref:Plasma membrane calcium transporting P-type ATPase C-terminal domain-containing protein n=1 Tax=Protopolystoma xenopodis TaxID=117903 RepID=A0A448XF00_9PLAT|nr:unnamed protein product [Protopolystoma xenopodis]